MTTADTLGGTPPWTGLARWQGTGLALAVVAWGVYDGLGALLGAVLLSPAIIALVRLRKHAPEARSTADLVGATISNRAGMFTGALQVVAYLLLAVIAARALSLPVAAYSVDYSAMQDTWSWPLVAVAAVVLAGLAAYLLPDRAIGGIAVVLAGVALLINFYLALAVLARVYRGVVDVPVGADDRRGRPGDRVLPRLVGARKPHRRRRRTAARRGVRHGRRGERPHPRRQHAGLVAANGDARRAGGRGAGSPAVRGPQRRLRLAGGNRGRIGRSDFCRGFRRVAPMMRQLRQHLARIAASCTSIRRVEVDDKSV